jgi:hypothetical protein
MADRFHYFRWHSHPLGWGVRDSKHDCVVALGDKGICATLAALMNGSGDDDWGSLGKDLSLMADYARQWDAYVKAGAPTWKPETD